MPVRTMPWGARGAVTVFVLGAVLLAGAVATAGPAAAVDDPTRPDARVTHGPSCRPGGVVIEVTAGAAPYAVLLATTRLPGGEDSAELLPGDTVVLRTGDVAWGETIDTRLEYTALDGSGTAYADELDGYSFTRPAEEDCAAITPPRNAGTVPSPGAQGGSAPVVALPHVEVLPMPVPGAPEGGGADGAPPVVTASAREVVAGTDVLLHGQGFAPGERVGVRVGKIELGAEKADLDGVVQIAVRIPGATAGSTAVQLHGSRSGATAEVDLVVAALPEEFAAEVGGVPWPLLGVLAGLLAGAGGMAAVSGRRTRPARGPLPPAGG